MPDRQGIDPARLARGSQLAVKQVGEAQFRVKGQNEPWYSVDLSVDPPCYCADQLYRGRGCKHELAARLASGDMPLIQMLGDALLRAQKIMEEHMKRTARPSRSTPSARSPRAQEPAA